MKNRLVNVFREAFLLIGFCGDKQIFFFSRYLYICYPKEKNHGIKILAGNSKNTWLLPEAN